MEEALKMKKIEEEEEEEEEKGGGGGGEEETKKMSRKEKRKAMKKMKRKEIRKDIAAKERAEEEARLNDPEEQRRLELLEQEEAERMERDRKLFEESEKAWMEERIRREQQQQQQQEQTNLLEETEPAPNENENENDDDEWEYVEEGPPQIIWQGNEIIFKKNRVRVRVSNKEPNQNQDADNDNDRPTSNPFPPESRTSSPTQQPLEKVAQQIPNFGTEQDKAHCPFHLKTGACRFGQRCSRVHFYPDKSCTILIKNMYNGPGLAWEQDEGLEYMDEEVERCFEEFYEDVHTEFQKFGEIVNFKVCKNGSFHLRGNVYVQYRFLDSALLAYNSVNGRYFAGKQISCNFVNLTRWKVAICGEYMKSGFKTCSHGTACNFIHCFRNPGGDYEWADSDRPPPKYWVKNMAALFGYSDDYEALREQESFSVLKNNSKMSKTDSGRYHSSRSRSREMDWSNSFSGRRKHGDDRNQGTPDEEWNANLKDNHKMKRRTPDTDSDREWLDKDEDRKNQHKHARKSSFNSNKDDSRISHDEDFDMEWATTRDNDKEHGREPRNSRKGNRGSREWIYESESDGDRDRKRHHSSRRKNSRHQSRGSRTGEAESSKILFDQGDLEERDGSKKSSRRRRSGLQDDNKDYENENEEVGGGWSRWQSDRQSQHHKKKSSKHKKKLDSIKGDN